jgi:hypothetical protein
MLARRFALRVVSIALGLSFALPARAADWYVDAVNGSNANSGMAPGAAWQTITHALSVISTLPNDIQVIHVAPGVYNPALGESFPLAQIPRTRIVGTAGSAQTILEGPASSLLAYHYDAIPVDALTGADGLTLRQAVTGVAVGAGSVSPSPAFHDLRIENMSGPGVQVMAASGSGGVGAGATFERLDVFGCDVGILVYAQGGGLGFGGAWVDVTECVVRTSTNDGIHLTAAGNAGASVHVRRARILDNGGHGVYSSSGGGSGAVTSATLTAEASVIAGNHGCGILGEGTGSTSGHIDLYDCTVANNAVCGVRGSYSQNTILSNSIFFGNADDLDLSTVPNASFSDSGDGALLGFTGCIAANPDFANARIRDYRLRFGSPCAETGDPGAIGRLDLLGHARAYDGDLDTQSAVDMGAFEFEPLHLLGVPALGQTIGFEFWGAAGGSSTLWFAPAPLIAPQSTPFGLSYLDPSLAASLGSVPVRPGRPFVLRRTLPSNPLLVGRTFSFQALTSSSAAPQGQAYTNAISFVVLP